MFCKSESLFVPEICNCPEFMSKPAARLRMCVWGMPVKKNWEADWLLPNGPDNWPYRVWCGAG